jgi:hypothetical protein
MTPAMVSTCARPRATGQMATTTTMKSGVRRDLPITGGSFTID